ncbi:MAG: hypothetical protein R6V56_07010 [Lentisphaeria bacterium]
MLNTIKLMATLAAVGCIAGSGLAWGQQGQRVQPQSEENKGLKELRGLRKKSQDIQAQLDKIAQAARKENPELDKMQKDLQELFREKLNEYGYPSEDEMQELREMQQKLQKAGDMEPEKRQQLTQKFQKQVAQLQQARQKAQQDEKVVKALEEMQQLKSKAMNEVSDDARQLQEKQIEIQKKIQKLEQEMYKKQ